MASDIASLLANAAHTDTKFDLFQTLERAYQEGRDNVYKRRTQDAFMGPDVLTDGKLDPAKMQEKAARVGGLPAAELLGKLYESGLLQERYRATEETNTDRFRPGGQTPPPSSPGAAPSSGPFPPSPSRPPSTATVAPDLTQSRGNQVQSRSLPPPPQAATAFTPFLTAQGVPPDQQQAEAIKLQEGFMRATGRPFDTSKQLNLADLDTRQVLGSWVMNRARAGEQPQAGMATQIGPGSPPPSGPAGALAQGQSPFVPQGGGAAPPAPPPQQQTPLPPPPPPAAAQPPAQQPMVPRPVQTESIQQTGPVDSTINAIIGPAEIQRFGSWQRALQYYEDRLSRGAGLMPAAQADLEKKVAAIRAHLTLTDPQKEWEFERARNPGTPPYAQWQDEKKAREGRIKADTAVAEELIKNAAQIQTTMPILQQVAALAKTAPGGQAGVLAAKLAPIMSSLGMKVPEGISDAEALNSSIMRLLPLVRQPGSVSNYEQQSYINALPSLSLSVEGRAKAIDMMLKLANRGVAVANAYRDNIGAADLSKKLAALDAPVFSKDERAELDALVTKARGDNLGWQEYKPGVRMRVRDK